MFRYGLKLWSTNRTYIAPAVQLHRAGVYDYIELFTLPGTCEEYAPLWAELDIPFIVHAPHYDKGVNLSRPDQLAKNMMHAREAIRFADMLKANSIIFHPGIEGSINETARQLRQINDTRIVIENKPALGRDDERCVGSTPDEISFIMEHTGVGFCLDIGHAICAANHHRIEPFAFLSSFLALKPTMFHFTDGDFTGMYDRHDHFGAGTYPVHDIVRLLPPDTAITIETNKDSKEVLDDFAADIAYLKHVQAELVKEGYYNDNNRG